MTNRISPPPQTDAGEPPADVLVLTPEQHALLQRLAGGQSLAAAAAAEFVSVRTADRRMARARRVLGVRRTRDAVLVYRCHYHPA